MSRLQIFVVITSCDLYISRCGQNNVGLADSSSCHCGAVLSSNHIEFISYFRFQLSTIFLVLFYQRKNWLKTESVIVGSDTSLDCKSG